MTRLAGRIATRPGNVAVIDAVEDWLASRRLDLRPSTWKDYEGVATVHISCRFECVTIGELPPPAIRAWLATLSKEGVGAPTISKARAVLSMVLDRAVADGLIPANPVLGSGIEPETVEVVIAHDTPPGRVMAQPVRRRIPRRAQRDLG